MNLNFSEENDRLTLSVSDNGAGVPKEKQNSLFVRFAQIDLSSGGTGVGLHLTAELAAVHKGKAEYAPSELGGACFSVYVPLSDGNYEKEEIVETQVVPKFTDSITDVTLAPNAPADLNQNKRYQEYKLLIIEDDDEVRDFLFNQLNDFFSVFVAKDGAEGLEKAVNEQLNLIVCDVIKVATEICTGTRSYRSSD
jgi:hypothetical protein